MLDSGEDVFFILCRGRGVRSFVVAQVAGVFLRQSDSSTCHTPLREGSGGRRAVEPHSLRVASSLRQQKVRLRAIVLSRLPVRPPLIQRRAEIAKALE